MMVNHLQRQQVLAQLREHLQLASELAWLGDPDLPRQAAQALRLQAD
jgi:hypothetical protein